MTDVRIALTTFASASDAERVVRALVEEKLVACGNIVPGVVSLYTWQGATERAAEVIVLFKTTEAGVPALRERLMELHPYEVPELLVVRVEGGNLPYLEWVKESVGLKGLSNTGSHGSQETT